MIIFEITFLVSVKNRHSERIHLKITQNVLDVELSEREYFRYFVVFKVLFLEDLAAVAVDDVSEFVDEVASTIDLPPQLVKQITLLVRNRNEVALIILFKLADAIGYVVSAPVVIKQLGQIAVRSRMRLVKLFATVIVFNVA